MGSSLFLILIVVFVNVHSYNILGIFPHPGKSHVDVFQSLMKGLANKGHTVAVMSHHRLLTPLPRYKDISLIGEVKPVTEIIDMEEIGKLGRYARYLEPILLAQFGNMSCEAGLSLDRIQNFIKKEEQFDVIIAEFFNTDCYLGFALKLKAPLIGITSSNLMPWTYQRFGNPDNAAYIPNILMSFSDKMTFLERLENTIAGILHRFYYENFINRNDERILKKYFGDQMPPLRDAIYNSSLILTNAHFSLNLPKPLVPNVIEVAGIHIREVRHVPKNIEKWINESSEGVIYFSLGSMIKGHTFPADKRKEFLKAFGRLRQRVLWKWENETMDGKPDNVMIQKWMPQYDVLCHPNVKAFISHGGLLGTIEAVHCGVPIIVMPQFGDQHTNARALEANGGGVILQLKDATEDKIFHALKTVLSPKFRQQAKGLSERFRDRPLPPMDTAIYWIEYVARHKGAPHMRTAAINMPFYKYYLLDVISFLLLLLGLVLYAAFYAIRFALRRLLPQNVKVKTN